MGWPTTSDPRTEFVTVRLTVTEALELDAYQASIGAKSRSEAVRRVLAAALRQRATSKAKMGKSHD